MLNFNPTEQHYIEIASHINLDEIDYDSIMREQTRHTYTYLTIGGAFFIVAFVFFIGELLPKMQGIGTIPVSILFLGGIICFFHAMKFQKEMETRVTYEIMQKIQAIEGDNGFLWRINAVVNACCQAEYGGLPDAVQQLQTSSQSGGIDISEIRLYKGLLEKVVRWYEQQQPQE